MSEIPEPDITDLMFFGTLKVNRDPDAIQIWAAYRASDNKDKATFYPSLLQLVNAKRALEGQEKDQAKLEEEAAAKRRKKEEEERARTEKSLADAASMAKQVTEAAEAVMRAQKRKEDAIRKAEEEAAQAAALKKKEEAAREKEEAARKEEEQRQKEEVLQRQKAKAKEEKAAAEKKKSDEAASMEEALEKFAALSQQERDASKEHESGDVKVGVFTQKTSKSKPRSGSGGGSSSSSSSSSSSGSKAAKADALRPGEAETLDSEDEADMKDLESLDLSHCQKRVATKWTDLPSNGNVYEGEVVRIPKGSKKGCFIRHGKGTYRRFKNGEMLLEMTGTFEKHSFVRGIIKQGGATGFIYTGAVLNNTFHGKGVLKRENGQNYAGFFCEGEYHGQGKFTSDKLSYDGLFHRGDFHGQGTLTDADGTVTEGEWKEGKVHGNATRSTNSYVSKGQWVAGKLHGNGVFTDKSKDVIYEGEFREGMMHGNGVLKEGKISTFTGEWKEGQLDGPVTLVQGNKTIEGQWRAGLPTGAVKVTRDGQTRTGVFKNGKIILDDEQTEQFLIKRGHYSEINNEDDP